MKSILRDTLSIREVTPLEALKKALDLSPKDLIEQIRESGLKGRGGAGFPTAVKWSLTAAAPGATKYLICNADEGEPGTFKDRDLLNHYADHVLTGMTMAGYAIGANSGILYLRQEYAFMRAMFEDEIQKRRQSSMLGANILGKSGFSFDITLRMGAGAYVCGEETALIESLEGNRGEPRNRPPFPVDTGYNDCPTSVNNVETLVWALCIIDKGAKWFKQYGTEKSPGLKLLSISGDCQKPGVYECAFGITVREMLEAVGAEDAKAVQIGGASGICVPAKEFGRKIAFEDISTGGSVITFGPNRDMLRVAKNFMEFFVEESCGQCTPCRVGNRKLLEGIEMLEKNECSIKYLKELKALGETMQIASKCGLGQTSPNAFLSIIEHFPHEIMGRHLS